jgi:hypothetical protein
MARKKTVKKEPKEKVIKYPGMRKPTERIDPRTKKKKRVSRQILDYGEFPYKRRFSFVNGRIDPQQKDDYEDFMKVKEGETHDQWIERTKFKRVAPIRKLQSRKSRYKTVYSNVRQKKRSAYQKMLDEMIKIHITKRDYGFMRNLVNVLYWASAKYDVENHFLQIGLLFYNDAYPVTKDQFKQRLCMMTGNTDKAFHQFKIRGYLKEIMDKKLYFEKEVTKKTGLFMLSDKLNGIMREIYEKMVLLGAFENFGKPLILNSKVLDSPEEKAIFEELKKMHSEYMEILQGQKEHEGFPCRRILKPKK